jgi:inhibitor of cysteine peptidase
VVAVPSACGGDDDGNSSTGTEPASALTEDGASFVVQVGEDFRITLESNPSTGYRWELAEALDGGVLEFIGETYLEPDTELVGAPGRQVLDFRGVGQGSTFVQLWYIRPTDDPPQAADRAQFDVTVGRPGGDDGSETSEQPVTTPLIDPNALTVAELIDRVAAGRGTGEFTVVTVLFDDGTGLRMCEVLAESFPPQCVGLSIDITNPDVVDADFTVEGDVRWTDRPVQLTGTIDGETFTVS